MKFKTSKNIKVDFLLNEALINKPIKNTLINLEYELFYESVEDIIAKKVKYRKEDNLTRDIFDLAVAISKDSGILQNLLYTRFITTDDLEKLNLSLNSLDNNVYKTELEKIEPENEYIEISLDAHSIIQNSIVEILSK